MKSCYQLIPERTTAKSKKKLKWPEISSLLEFSIEVHNHHGVLWESQELHTSYQRRKTLGRPSGSTKDWKWIVSVSVVLFGHKDWHNSFFAQNLSLYKSHRQQIHDVHRDETPNSHKRQGIFHLGGTITHTCRLWICFQSGPYHKRPHQKNRIWGQTED